MEKEEQKTLEQIASVPARSNKKGMFTDQTRLSVLRGLTKESPYRPVYTGNSVELYAKTSLTDLPKNVLVLSGHCDVVRSIKDGDMFSTYDENVDVLTGTYDNAISNAAMVELMRKKDLPENVVFAFTADEETGRCRGAGEVLSVLGHDMKRRLFAIALDVTYENHFGCLYSMENICLSPQVLKDLGEKMQELDKDLPLPPGRYVRLDKKTDLSFVRYGQVSRMESWMDEGQFYGKYIPAVSFCLPLTGGEMHQASGCHTKGRVYDGYIESLAQFSMLVLGKEPDKAWNDHRIQLSKGMSELQDRINYEWMKAFRRRMEGMPVEQDPLLPEPIKGDQAQEGQKQADDWEQMSFLDDDGRVIGR